MRLAFKEQTSNVIFQIRRPICKSAGQSDIGRLVDQFANWPDWQIVRNISKSIWKRVPCQHGQERSFLGIKHHGKMKQHIFFGPAIQAVLMASGSCFSSGISDLLVLSAHFTAHPLESLHARTVTTKPTFALLVL